MKLSICMITYNHEKYIAQAIESAMMQQTNFDYELVVGEDCSTDNTREILLSYKRKYPNKIRLLIREKNIGMQQNGRLTREECNGEYLAILEGDDFWTSPLKLQKQVDYLDEHPECIGVFHPADMINDQGQVVGNYPRFDSDIKGFSVEELLFSNSVPTCSIVVRKSFINSLPVWYDNAPVGDWPLVVLAALRGTLMCINETMATYRVHNSGVWSGLATIDRKYALDLSVYKIFNRHLPRRFRPSIRTAVAHRYIELARFFEEAGMHAQARRYTLKRFITCPFDHTHWESVPHQMIRLITPGIYRALRRFKKCFNSNIGN